jgi:hypothetical protein
MSPGSSYWTKHIDYSYFVRYVYISCLILCQSYYFCMIHQSFVEPSRRAGSKLFRHRQPLCGRVSQQAHSLTLLQHIHTSPRPFSGGDLRVVGPAAAIERPARPPLVQVPNRHAYTRERAPMRSKIQSCAGGPFFHLRVTLSCLSLNGSGAAAIVHRCCVTNCCLWL